jgi:hypothetical protein
MSDIKVRVGQQNAVKVISSISGSAGGRAVTAENVIGGIGSIRELHVSGISTFVGVSTFKNDVFIDGDLRVGDDLIFDEFTARNGQVTGITTLFNLNVTGVSTFVGVSTFKNDVYIDGDLRVGDDLIFDEFTARNGQVTGITTLFNLNVTGVSTIGDDIYIDGSIYYTAAHPTYGVLFFGPGGLISATNSPGVGNTDITNYVLTTNNSNVPIWSDAIDGGTY